MIRKKWKNVIVIVLIIFVSMGIGAYAEYVLNATEVSYAKQGSGTMSVKQALDDLYTKVPKLTQGQLVTYRGEQFYVLYESKDTVELFAKTNLNTAATAQANATYNTTGCVFAGGDTQYWGNNPGLNLNLEQGYGATDAIGKTRNYAKAKGAISGRLLTKQEVESLTGCTDKGGYFDYSSTSNTTIKDMINGAGNSQGFEHYWLGSGNENTANLVWFVHGASSQMSCEYINNGNHCGVRPVINVYKSDVTLAS